MPVSDALTNETKPTDKPVWPSNNSGGSLGVAAAGGKPGGWKYLALAVASAMIWGGQAMAEKPKASPPCTQVNATTFLLEGDINDATTACVREKLAPTTTDLIVDSNGGQVSAALDIAELLEPLSLTVHVRGGCYSSCANFFLPIADRLIVEPGATIVVHGGIDPQFLHRWNEERQERIKEHREQHPDLGPADIKAWADAADAKVHQEMERQLEFAKRNGVGLGWFLYREEDDDDVGPWLSGRHGPTSSLFGGWRLLLVEEPMVRSCLPRVKVEPFQQELEKEFINNQGRYARFRDAKGMRSLNLRCATPASR